MQITNELLEEIKDAIVLSQASGEYPKRLVSPAEALALVEEIERMRADNARLREALKPFAAIANDYNDQDADDFEVFTDFDNLGASLPLKRFRRARAALEGK